MKSDLRDSTWTDEALADLRDDFGEFFSGGHVSSPARTASWARTSPRRSSSSSADVHAFVRATVERRAEQHRRLARADQGALRRPDRQDRRIDYLVRELLQRPTVRTSSTSAHRHTSASLGIAVRGPWMANTVGTLNLSSRSSTTARAREVDTAGTSEEYANPRERSRTTTTSTTPASDSARALADQPQVDLRDIEGRGRLLTMNYHDAFGVPGVVTRMFNNYGPRQNPRYVTGHDHHAGARRARRSSSGSSSRCATSASAPTASAAT
jgi:dTDP-glucose 4,6-dehydratase